MTIAHAVVLVVVFALGAFVGGIGALSVAMREVKRSKRIGYER